MLFTLSSSSACLVIEQMCVYTWEHIIYMSDCADFGHEDKKMHPRSHVKGWKP